MVYAVYPGDLHCHIVASAGVNRTLCGLPTKGSRRDVREPRPAARLTLNRPVVYTYNSCPLCVSALENSSGRHD